MANQRCRVYRFVLDPTRSQQEALARHAGAARWAYNHALAVKYESLRRRQLQINELVTIGLTDKEAREQATVTVPYNREIRKRWIKLRGDETEGIDGICPWWRTVCSFAFQSAWDDADAAWKNWIRSVQAKQPGRSTGPPKFKKKGQSRDSFRLYHKVSDRAIRPEGYRRLRIPRVGSMRVHDSTKRLYQACARGGVIKSVTVTRYAHRWYAAVLVAEPLTTPEPTRAQRKAGTVGVDLGVLHLAAFSTGETIPNPRHLRKAEKRIAKAHRAFSRTRKGSARRSKASARFARRHHEVAAQRAAYLHQITTRLATEWSAVAIEDLNVAGMTSSAHGTLEQPGKNIKAKAALNRSILDTAPGEFRWQLTYKTALYGSTLAICDRWTPTSKTCSRCGDVKPTMPLKKRVFTCDYCGLVLDRDVNAARNIAAAAFVASDSGETLNARGGSTRPPSGEAGASEAGRSRRTARSPRSSNAPAVPV